MSAMDGAMTTRTTKNRWNWGGFWLTWVWGIANSTWVALLALIPFVNIGVAFYLGYKGDQLAWENKQWYDEAHFREVQRKWALAGWVITIIYTTISGFELYDRVQTAKLEQRIVAEVEMRLLEDPTMALLMGGPLETKIVSGLIKSESNSEVIASFMILMVTSENGRFYSHISLGKDYKIEQIDVKDLTTDEAYIVEMR